MREASHINCSSNPSGYSVQILLYNRANCTIELNCLRVAGGCPFKVYNLIVHWSLSLVIGLGLGSHAQTMLIFVAVERAKTTT